MEGRDDAARRIDDLARERFTRAERKLFAESLVGARALGWNAGEVVRELTRGWFGPARGLLVVSDQRVAFVAAEDGSSLWELSVTGGASATLSGAGNLTSVRVDACGESRTVDGVGEWYLAARVAAAIERRPFEGEVVLPAVRLVVARYLGGHPAREERAAGLFVVTDACLGIWDPTSGPVFGFPWAEAISVDIEGSNEVRSRVTVTRLLALGIFALAVPKSESIGYVVIETVDGEAIFEVDARIVDLRAWWGQRFAAVSAPRSGAPDSVPSQSGGSGTVGSIAERLAALADLRDRDLVSAAEYDDHRARILNQL